MRLHLLMILGELISMKGNFSRGSGSDSCRGDLNGLWIYQRREKVYDRYDLRHRDMKEESESFASIFYRADKLSKRLHPLQSKTGMLLAGRKEKQQVYI